MPEDKATQALRELEEMGVSVEGVVEMARIAKAKAEGRAYLLPINDEKRGLMWELHGPKHRAFFLTKDRLAAVVQLAKELAELDKLHNKPRTILRKAK